jgi:beta-glucosidase
LRDEDLPVISAPIDFLGINYYQRWTVAAASDVTGPHPASVPSPINDDLGAEEIIPGDIPTSAAGWPIEPVGLIDALTRAGSYADVPIYITENGIAVADRVAPGGAVEDDERVAYLQAHLATLAEAIQRGLDVRGYFVWSVLDNFEWEYGYALRFGLVYVDYTTQKRIPKRSYAWYRRMIGSHTTVAS